MNFIDLQAVIQHVKEFMKCQTCGNNFPEKTIKLIATLGNEGLVTTFCDKCNVHALINFSVSKVVVKTDLSTKITLKEVTDLHNLLQDFKGDLKELLT